MKCLFRGYKIMFRIIQNNDFVEKITVLTFRRENVTHFPPTPNYHHDHGMQLGWR